MLKKIMLMLTMIFTVAPSVLYADDMYRMAQEIREQDQEIADACDKAKSLFDEKKYHECIKAIDDIITLAKKKIKNVIIRHKYMSFLWAWRGAINLNLDCYDDVISDCEQALFIDEHNGYAYFVKSSAYNMRGDKEMGLACLRLSAQKGWRQAKEIVYAYNL